MSALMGAFTIIKPLNYENSAIHNWTIRLSQIFRYAFNALDNLHQLIQPKSILRDFTHFSRVILLLASIVGICCKKFLAAHL